MTPPDLPARASAVAQIEALLRAVPSHRICSSDHAGTDMCQWCHFEPDYLAMAAAVATFADAEVQRERPAVDVMERLTNSEIASFSVDTVRDLIARVAAAERERDRARVAALGADQLQAALTRQTAQLAAAQGALRALMDSLSMCFLCDEDRGPSGEERHKPSCLVGRAAAPAPAPGRPPERGDAQSRVESTAASAAATPAPTESDAAPRPEQRAGGDAELLARAEAAERERDAWKRAHDDEVATLRAVVEQADELQRERDEAVMCDAPPPGTLYLMDPDYSRWWVTWTCEGGHTNVTGKLDKQPEVVTRVYQ